MRIWIARPEPGAARTATKLRSLGHCPLIEPLFEIAATDDLPPRGEFAGILISSGQAGSALARTGLDFSLPAFAVGARSAEAASRAGFRNVLAAGGDAASLSRLVREHLPVGAVLLHVAGMDRKSEPGASLEAAGYGVRIWTAYVARALPQLPPGIARALLGQDPLGGLDAALHYSRRSAETALNLARSAGLVGAFHKLNHYCLSPDVALPLVESGIAAHFVPARPTEEALLDGLDGSAGSRPIGTG